MPLSSVSMPRPPGKFDRRDEHAGALDGPTVIGGKDAAGDAAGRGRRHILRLGGRVARRLLAACLARS